MSTPSRNSGRYRFPAKLYRVPERTDLGGSNELEEIAELWVSVEPKASSEQSVADQMESIDRYNLRTPWTPLEIDNSMEIKTPKHHFAIQGVINVGELNEEWLITAMRLGKGYDV